jgi:FKBP-type peptidyl-prolyl cis-trans isomerase (trigger factor)
MLEHITNIKVTRDENAWEVEIRAEIPAEAMAHYREEALKEIQKTATLDGFRPGKAPVERIVAVHGEGAIMRHAAEHAIEHELPELFAAEKLLIIDAPKVTTESPEAGKPLPFTARASLAPKVELPDYKRIAAARNAKKEDAVVSDEEHAQALTHLRRERARIDKIEAGADAQKAAEESRAAEEKDLPALDDEFVQSLGYESTEKFADALRTNIKNEKEIQLREKRRAGILDDLVAKATVKYPTILRTYELDDMEARMKSDLEQMGTTFDAYLVQAKKTREDLHKEWNDAADKRTKVRLILSEIARTESIEPDQTALEKEVTHAREHYKDADPNILRTHIAHAMRNEAVLNFLENL